MEDRQKIKRYSKAKVAEKDRYP